MAPTDVQLLSAKEAVARVFYTLECAKPGDAPFALVLGSGFSRGLVPTAKELIAHDLPLWLHARRTRTAFADRMQRSDEERRRSVVDFWKRFKDDNEELARKLEFDGQGVPTSYADAYQAAFDSRSMGALGNPALAREFQRDLMQLDRPRLNAAHFFLASILGMQPRPNSADSGAFRCTGAFSRLVLTTNFDPFLQTALQLVGRLYFMSDRPDLGIGNLALGDELDAVHIVYVHGSVHRPLQAANQNDIRQLRDKNSRFLADILRTRGVIVLGYSGWDDAIVEALSACDSFDHHLYWCGLESDPRAAASFGPKVLDILRKPTASYVHIPRGAGAFMAELYGRLLKGLPRLLDNPVEQVRETLLRLSFDDVNDMSIARVDGEPVTITAPMSTESSRDTLQNAVASVLDRLHCAADCFAQKRAAKLDSTAASSALAEQSKHDAEASSDTSKETTGALSRARVQGMVGNFEQALETCDNALKRQPLSAAERAALLLERANMHYAMEHEDLAIADWKDVVQHGPSAELVGNALFALGVLHQSNGDLDLAEEHYTQLIDHFPNVPDELVAKALYNRGISYGQRGRPDNELADYSRVVDGLRGVPVELLATVLYNRGIVHGDRGEIDEALGDYTRIIEALPGAPVEQIALALNNRGNAHGERGDMDKQLADYSRVIDGLPGCAAEHVALALNNRGRIHGNHGNVDEEITDYSRIIDRLPGASVEQIAEALNDRGDAHGKRGDVDKQLADYTRVIDGLPGAPVEQIAVALKNRATVHRIRGDTQKALADHTRLIETLPDAPAKQVAVAYGERGWIRYLERAFEAFLADTQRAHQNAPELDNVAFNFGLALLANGRDEHALAAYERAGRAFPDQIEELAVLDLRAAVGDWLTPERARPCIELLESLKPPPNAAT